MISNLHPCPCPPCKSPFVPTVPWKSPTCSPSIGFVAASFADWHWARHLGTMLSVPTMVFEATTENASFGLVGSQRGWGNATPGRLINTILQHRIGNSGLWRPRFGNGCDGDRAASAIARASSRLRLSTRPCPPQQRRHRLRLRRPPCSLSPVSCVSVRSASTLPAGYPAEHLTEILRAVRAAL